MDQSAMARFVLMLSCASTVSSLNAGAAGAALSRRAALMGAAALPFALRNPALAADNAGIVERAEKQALKVDLAISRATKGDLFDPSGQSCQVLDQVLGVDKKVLRIELQELEQLKFMQAQGETVAPEKFQRINDIKARIDKQVGLHTLEWRTGPSPSQPVLVF
jgi:hypothetical protein